MASNGDGVQKWIMWVIGGLLIIVSAVTGCSIHRIDKVCDELKNYITKEDYRCDMDKHDRDMRMFEYKLDKKADKQ